MILVFDVGNTETTIGLFEGPTLRAHWRVTTVVERTPDELVLLIRQLFSVRDIALDAVEGTALGSVVPAVTGPLADACRQCFSAPVVVVDASSKLPIRLAVDEPLTVGADRIINTLAASRLYKKVTIVVDLGTATTYGLHHRRRDLSGRGDRAWGADISRDAVSSNGQAAGH